MKGASIFDPRMIELQKDYATKLLTHRNPYTGLRYVDDPAIAVVETTNENSIFYFFRNADLSLPYYRDALTMRWNRWLLDRYRDRAAVAAAWTDADGRCALQAEEDPQAGVGSDSLRHAWSHSDDIRRPAVRPDACRAAGERSAAVLRRDSAGLLRGHASASEADRRARADRRDQPDVHASSTPSSRRMRTISSAAISIGDIPIATRSRSSSSPTSRCCASTSPRSAIRCP